MVNALLSSESVHWHAAVQMKKRSEETQTLCAGCSKAEPKFFCPGADHLPGGAGRPKFNQPEVVTTFTYKPSLVRIDACNSSYRGNKTHKHSHKPTNRLQYTAPQLVQSVIIVIILSVNSSEQTHGLCTCTASLLVDLTSVATTSEIHLLLQFFPLIGV